MLIPAINNIQILHFLSEVFENNDLGLDALINYYKSNNKTGLQHCLSDHVPLNIAPPEVRLHGTENLLHRACKVGDLKVVSELLAVGYR